MRRELNFNRGNIARHALRKRKKNFNQTRNSFLPLAGCGIQSKCSAGIKGLTFFYVFHPLCLVLYARSLARLCCRMSEQGERYVSSLEKSRLFGSLFAEKERERLLLREMDRFCVQALLLLLLLLRDEMVALTHICSGGDVHSNIVSVE